MGQEAWHRHRRVNDSDSRIATTCGRGVTDDGEDEQIQNRSTVRNFLHVHVPVRTGTCIDTIVLHVLVDLRVASTTRAS